ncbi:hypothetical protein dqs_0614 [Azoarcus olearius]|uniref:DUF1804 family protein n=1 Tax=Azoarcus sp. (strain BH72) TaxID=418699 RepID=UPI0008061DA5|nr:DUF1804 family protein [Azoarcus olearius]ANQ83690.1 hypothetical protein dqs_0614 [Azoarcus olearius]
MAHPDDTRRAVRAGYVFDQLGLEVAAVKEGVPVATARRWKAEAKKAGDDWDRARGAQLLAGGGIEDVVRQTLAVVVQQVQATVESINLATDMDPATKVQMLASLADAYHKLMAVSKRLMPETDKLAIAMDVLKRFGEFIAKRKPALAGEFVEQIEAFGDEIARAYG